MFEFKIESKEKKCRARTGAFKTPHGLLQIPELAIVATDGHLKGMNQDDMKNVNLPYSIVNTFHTFTKNIVPHIEATGGIHKYMNNEKVRYCDT